MPSYGLSPGRESQAYLAFNKWHVTGRRRFAILACTIELLRCIICCSCDFDAWLPRRGIRLCGHALSNQQRQGPAPALQPRRACSAQPTGQGTCCPWRHAGAGCGPWLRSIVDRRRREMDRVPMQLTCPPRSGSSALCVVVTVPRFGLLSRDDVMEGRCCNRLWFLDAMSRVFDVRAARWSCCQRGAVATAHDGQAAALARSGA